MALFLRGESAKEEERECMGIEPTLHSQKNLSNPVAAGAESGAKFVEKHAIDADLSCVINAWPILPAAIRRAVLALVAEGHTSTSR
jgi:hypothetical protein